MADVLIRDVPDEVIAMVDAHAARLGLSRSEYVRRRLAQDAMADARVTVVADLQRFAGDFGDLAHPDWSGSLPSPGSKSVTRPGQIA